MENERDKEFAENQKGNSGKYCSVLDVHSNDGKETDYVRPALPGKGQTRPPWSHTCSPRPGGVSRVVLISAEASCDLLSLLLPRKATRGLESLTKLSPATRANLEPVVCCTLAQSKCLSR